MRGDVLVDVLIDELEQQHNCICVGKCGAEALKLVNVIEFQMLHHEIDNATNSLDANFLMKYDQ